LKCHSIAGAGGRVGPDLVSIGASAQVDYLIESILVPSAKIKENYHSLTVVVDGCITSGVKVRETDKELVLRDAEDREVSLALDSIEEKIEGGSLMPVGLADTLTRGELVDLVRFLSELGKVGPFATDNARVVRRWQALAPVTQSSSPLDFSDSDLPLSGETAANWTAVYSRVSGSLPLESIPTAGPDGAGGPLRLVRFQLDVTTAGKVKLLVAGGVDKMWCDGAPVAIGPRVALDLPEGVYTIALLLNGKSTDDLRLELADVPGSPAQVQIVGGK
jgi:putative heme-binding domain-containing protein